MTLKELNIKLTAMLEINERHGDKKVCVVVDEGGWGGVPTSDVEHASCGIDWNHGQLLLVCKDKLVRRK